MAVHLQSLQHTNRTPTRKPQHAQLILLAGNKMSVRREAVPEFTHAGRMERLGRLQHRASGGVRIVHGLTLYYIILPPTLKPSNCIALFSAEVLWQYLLRAPALRRGLYTLYVCHSGCHRPYTHTIPVFEFQVYDGVMNCCATYSALVHIFHLSRSL